MKPHSSAWLKLRDDFPVTQNTIFLAHCAVAPMSIPSARESQKYFESRLRGERIPLDPIFQAGRKSAATILNASPDEIAFIRGTTEGINLLANMIHYKQGDNIVLNDMEYTSNVYPWMRQAKAHSLKIKKIRSKSDGLSTEDIIATIDDNTRVVALSSVQMANGFRCELREITEAAHKKGAFVAVDAIQSLGALIFDTRKVQIDFLAAGGHKWLLGPSGIGILYVKRDLIGSMEPMSVGPWQEEMTYGDMIDFSYREYKLAHTAKRFEFGGHPNVSGVMGLCKALEYLLKIGIENIEERVLYLNRYLIEELTNSHLKIPAWTEEAKFRSAYVGYTSKRNAVAVKNYAANQGIAVAPSKTVLGERIRIAPHFYNTTDEIRKAVGVLSHAERLEE